MTLLFIEGFETLQSGTEANRKYDFVTSAGVGLARVAGRHWGFAASLPTGQFNFQHLLLDGAQSTLIMGCSVRFDDPADGGAVLRVMDNGSASVEARLNIITSGVTAGFFKLQFEVGGASGYTDLGTTEYALNTWYFLEWKLTFGLLTGSYEVLVDSVSELSSTNVRVGKNAIDCDQISLGGNALTGFFYLDDFYCANSAGSQVNDLTGMIAIEGVAPIADGVRTQWTPTSASNYLDVDDVAVDDATTIVSASAGSLEDLFDFASLAEIPSNILGVQVNIHAKMSSVVTTANMKVVCAIGGTSYPDIHPSIDMSSETDWVEKGRCFDYNPSTGVDWTVAGLNAAEFGMELDALVV